MNDSDIKRRLKKLEAAQPENTSYLRMCIDGDTVSVLHDGEEPIGEVFEVSLTAIFANLPSTKLPPGER